MYYWPGCEVTIRGTNATYCKAYTFADPMSWPTVQDLRNSIDQSLDAFENEDVSVAGN